MDLPEYPNLRTDGDVYVRPWSGRTIPSRSTKILIMGPTGSGKSSFIEALAGASHKLNISKNQLDGYTQGVSAYELINAQHASSPRDANPRPLFLIDTPGFSDSKITEMEIIKMVKKWIDDHQFAVVHHILYLCPITATRTSGSKRRTVEMFKSLLSSDQNKMRVQVTIVTTMWDQICNERLQQRAESNLKQLTEHLWKHFVDNGAAVTRFLNTKASALQIIGKGLESPGYTAMFDKSSPNSQLLCTQLLYAELLERIGNGLQQKHALTRDMAQPETRADKQLKAIVKRGLEDNERDLKTFAAQLVEFGEPPSGFEKAAVLLDVLPMGSRDRVKLGLMSMKKRGVLSMFGSKS